ncbi:hypothetical protein [Citrobacter phage Tr1]|nr:hypothetical protein [Citrobacter phage Tr1]
MFKVLRSNRLLSCLSLGFYYILHTNRSAL